MELWSFQGLLGLGWWAIVPSGTVMESWCFEAFKQMSCVELQQREQVCIHGSGMEFSFKRQEVAVPFHLHPAFVIVQLLSE